MPVILGSIIIVTLVLAPAVAQATDEDLPHVIWGTTEEACAMCHRAHTAASDTWYRSFSDRDFLRNALIVGVFGGGDSGLCFSCHGVAMAGSEVDVESSYQEVSTHGTLVGTATVPSDDLQCSDCHDVHGTDRDAEDMPFSALLRVFSEGVLWVYQGEEYCVVCHPADPDERWDGLDVFVQTTHYSEMAIPATGTGIRCSNCHDPHGSDSPPLIVDQVVPPAALATVSVPANVRRFCFSCHTTALDTYAGKVAYGDSSHALSTQTVTVVGTWASVDATRLVGECQVCHAPMGRDDGTGDVIPELTERAGRALCDDCHDLDGPASTDISSTVYPASASSDLEILVSVVPSTPTGYEERLSVYSRETAGADPLLMVGPREYRPSVSMGDISAGDIDGDGENELIVADPGQAELDIVSYDALRGLTDDTGTGSLSIAEAADLVIVADVILDGSGRPEIAVMNITAGTLRLYRYVSGSLTLVDGPISVGTAPSSLASGDVIGTAAHDLVVTASGDDTFRILTESAGTLSVSGPFATRSEPRGASVGDAWAGGTKDEIVIVNAGEIAGTVSVFGGDGIALGHFDDVAPAGDVPYDSVIADVLPGTTPVGTSGLEVSVVFRNENPGSSSSVNVFSQLAAGGLDTALGYETGLDFNSGTIAAGDVDGDGRVELIVGNGGRWSRDSSRQMPSIQVMRANAQGTTLATVETLWSGGTELAGEPPELAVADLGGVGRTRHAVSAVEGAHVSTETASPPRHVECVDCHDPHEATSTVSAAPDVYGVLTGAWGVSVTNNSTTSVTYTEKRGVDYEYELCFKCHTGWADLDGASNLAFEFNPLNLSEHAVEASSTDASARPGSYVSGWSNDSILFCVDCHGSSESAEATGPHSSKEAPLLKKPYLGTRTIESDLLCYECHEYALYYTGAADGVDEMTSLFYDSDLVPSGRDKLHNFHSATRGYGCAACHVAHGSRDERHLIRGEVDFAHAVDGGSCAVPCHTASARREYVFSLAPQVVSLETYDSAAHDNPVDTFTVGDTVYVLAWDLVYKQEVHFVWIDPNDTVVWTSNKVKVGADGTVPDTFNSRPGDTPGEYTVELRGYSPTVLITFKVFILG